MAQPTPEQTDSPRHSDLYLGALYDAAHTASGKRNPRRPRLAHEAGLRAVAAGVAAAPPAELPDTLRAIAADVGVPEDVVTDLVIQLVRQGFRFAYPGEHTEYGFSHPSGNIVDTGTDLAKAEGWRRYDESGDVVERVVSGWQPRGWYA